MADASTAPAPPRPDPAREGLWLEVAIAVVLSASALLTAWAGYQSTLWDGERAAHFTRADIVQIEAAQVATRAGQQVQLDALMFAQWLKARADGEAELQAFYRQRFRPEFKPYFDRWLEAVERDPVTAPSSPFALPEYRAGAEAFEPLHRRAEAEFRAGRRATEVGDHYVLATVFFANALFFGGICQVTRRRGPKVLLLAVAVVTCLLGLARVSALPALSL